VKDCCGNCPKVAKKEDQEMIDSTEFLYFFFSEICLRRGRDFLS
jgi:hypothetical protein